MTMKSKYAADDDVVSIQHAYICTYTSATTCQGSFLFIIKERKNKTVNSRPNLTKAQLDFTR